MTVQMANRPCSCAENCAQASRAPHDAVRAEAAPPSPAFARDFSRIPISSPDDPYENAADAAADRVMRTPEKKSPSESTRRGGGNLDPDTRAFMEPRFGADFSGVRIHTDAHAAAMTRRFRAEAFTVGSDVYFAPGQYSTGSDAGRRLLAHELAHTIQQDHSVVRRQAETGMPDVLDELDESPPVLEMAPPTVQRSTKWKGAKVHENHNKARDSLNGDAPITWEQLNGTSLKTEADAEGAIKLPKIKTSGSGKDWKAAVDSVPAQEGGDDENVLSSGPWSTVAPKAKVGTKYGLAKCSGAGNTTFSAHGKPSDNAVYKANRRHEDHHVADDKDAFDEKIGKWDKKVQQAKDKGTEFKGTSADKATEALWTAMGNTPKDAAKAFRALRGTKVVAYHGTVAGGKMVISNPTANADCSTSSVDVTNPS